MTQETLEEFAEQRSSLYYSEQYEPESWGNRKHNFIEGAKYQAERMYSEEEAGELVYNVIGRYGKHYGIMIDGAKLNELFEQFKKK